MKRQLGLFTAGLRSLYVELVFRQAMQSAETVGLSRSYDKSEHWQVSKIEVELSESET